MQLALVSGEYPPKQGGVGDFTQALALACASQNNAVRVICEQTSVANDSITPVTVQRVCSPRWGWRDLERVHRATATADLVNIQYQAAAYAGMRPPIHFLPNWLRYRQPKRRVVVTFHDLRIPYLFPKAGGLRQQAVRHLAHSAHGCIATNAADSAQLRAWGITHVAEIPIGSNIPKQPPAKFDRQAWRAAHSLTNGQAVVGYFGFLHPSKGGSTLLHALAQLPTADWQLLLIGGQTGSSDANTTAPYAAELAALAQQLGIAQHIRRTGFLPPPETSAALLSCDLMVQPYADGASLRRGTLLACLAHGIATLTTQPSQPLPGLHNGKNIWLVPAEQPAALAQALQTLLADQSLRQRLGAGGEQFAAQFSWDAIARQTLAFFQGL
jgi:glycosyltransferase involved in cell wall biosynthesis